MKTKLFFDMDGTIADLYNEPRWLEDIQAENPVFERLKPMVDMTALKELCSKLQEQGIIIGIITWLPMRASEQYEQECTIEKKKWIQKHLPEVTEFYAQRYGEPKQNAPFQRADYCNILVDDNAEVVNMWEKIRKHKAIKVENGNTIERIKEFFGI